MDYINQSLYSTLADAYESADGGSSAIVESLGLNEKRKVFMQIPGDGGASCVIDGVECDIPGHETAWLATKIHQFKTSNLSQCCAVTLAALPIRMLIPPHHNYKRGLQRISFILRSKKLWTFTGLSTTAVSTPLSVPPIEMTSSSVRTSPASAAAMATSLTTFMP